MSSAYYQQRIYIPQVDENDNFISAIERWEAHEKGILHRAFTVAVFYQGKIICQHRKHPVFDDVFDFTASSHPQVTNNNEIQSLEEAVMQTLEREWNLRGDDITNLVNEGYALYEDKDPNSKYTEHEYCHFFTAETDILPTLNSEIAYAFTLQSLSALKNQNNPILGSLAPWVKEALKKKLF